ncbi:TPA: phospholipase D-like domain-containing protein, partial [Escherichia coli]|nr:phospholipase D family protein [Escherichia coli]
MKALVAAKKRGVDVKIVIDERGNTGRASIAAMNYIANSGIPLRTDSNFPIQHDKVIIVDNVTVETGSFNFTKAAETKNSENAVVIWNMPKLAESFLEHWQDRWNQGRDYRSSY